MTRRDIAWLTAGMVLLTLGGAGIGALTALGIAMPHDPPGWAGAPVGLSLSFGLLCIVRGFMP